MFLVYYISMTTVGAGATDWTNDNLFGDGFFIGSDGGYGEADEAYEDALEVVNGCISYEAASGYGYEALLKQPLTLKQMIMILRQLQQQECICCSGRSIYRGKRYLVEDEETLATDDINVYLCRGSANADEETTNAVRQLVMQAHGCRAEHTAYLFLHILILSLQDLIRSDVQNGLQD